MVTQGQIDQILSGIALGLPLEDMLVLSEVSPQDMVELQKDEMFMAKANAANKKLTYDLLNNLHDIIDVQVRKGKDHAVTWLLEKTNPFFAAKGDTGDKPGVVNIFTQNTDIAASDTVAVNIYDQPSEPLEDPVEEPS